MILNETNETAAASWPNSSVHRWSDRWSVDFFANTILRWRSRGTRNCCVALLLLTKAFVGWCGDGGVWWGFFDPLSYREINPGGKFLCSLSSARGTEFVFHLSTEATICILSSSYKHTNTLLPLSTKVAFFADQSFPASCSKRLGGTLFRQM